MYTLGVILTIMISNNNVTHTVIAKPKFSSAYNMSYAEVTYSDEEANYVSTFECSLYHVESLMVA